MAEIAWLTLISNNKKEGALTAPSFFCETKTNLKQKSIRYIARPVFSVFIRSISTLAN
jgi:hypothetical protein